MESRVSRAILKDGCASTASDTQNAHTHTHTHTASLWGTQTHWPATICFPEWDLSGVTRRTVNQSQKHCIIVWELCPNNKIITLSTGLLWLSLATNNKITRSLSCFQTNNSVYTEQRYEVGTLPTTKYWQRASISWDKQHLVNSSSHNYGAIALHVHALLQIRI